MAYDSAFFDTIREGIQRSAGAVAPLLADLLAPAIEERTVIDVGCGEGHWGAEMAAHGFCVRGLDAHPMQTVVDVVECDLEQRLPDLGRFGMALCLEVAEHLSPQRAASFVADLCNLADVVVFSAAIPGQGGTGHRNEQWPDYWTGLFAVNGYACSGAMRWMIWDDERVENWYRQNLLVAARHPGRLPRMFDTPLAPVWPVVHPVLYDARRS